MVLTPFSHAQDYKGGHRMHLPEDATRSQQAVLAKLHARATAGGQGAGPGGVAAALAKSAKGYANPTEDTWYQTPLDVALHWGHYECAKVLIRKIKSELEGTDALLHPRGLASLRKYRKSELSLNHQVGRYQCFASFVYSVTSTRGVVVSMVCPTTSWCPTHVTQSYQMSVPLPPHVSHTCPTATGHVWQLRPRAMEQHRPARVAPPV